MLKLSNTKLEDELNYSAIFLVALSKCVSIYSMYESKSGDQSMVSHINL